MGWTRRDPDDASMQLKAMGARSYMPTTETRKHDTAGAFGGMSQGNRRSYNKKKKKRKGKR